LFSVRRLIAQCTLQVGALSAGSLAGLSDPGLVLAALGALLLLFCTAQLFNPYLLRVEDKEWRDRLARPDRHLRNIARVRQAFLARDSST
jgi:hypothetical protein